MQPSYAYWHQFGASRRNTYFYPKQSKTSDKKCANKSAPVAVASEGEDTEHTQFFFVLVVST